MPRIVCAVAMESLTSRAFIQGSGLGTSSFPGSCSRPSRHFCLFVYSRQQTDGISNGPGPWGYGRSGHNPHPQESHPLVDQEMQRSGAGQCRGASGGVKAQRSCDQFLPRRWAVCQGLGQACVGCEEGWESARHIE